MDLFTTYSITMPKFVQQTSSGPHTATPQPSNASLAETSILCSKLRLGLTPQPSDGSLAETSTVQQTSSGPHTTAQRSDGSLAETSTLCSKLCLDLTLPHHSSAMLLWLKRASGQKPKQASEQKPKQASEQKTKCLRR
ncbi:hypothetical protein HOO65_050450 [Ceratocystis lukuohia]|uniref:Uncharacterized protein n=1 Tax=Ceratocystis lukuohia TaxID=2019550 RepID=A0ABR4MGG6_9PEZI